MFLALFVSSLYLFLQVNTIYGGDAGDFASAIIVSGIPHPPGYPLYTLLGILATKLISLGTIAWKLGFLSSIPSILTILILYDLLFYLTKRVSISLISSLVLALLYPYWLYSVVVEAFSLNNLFFISLLWLLFHWEREGKPKYIYFASVLFGLSLSHHHIILFLVPSLLYLFLKKRKKVSGRLILTAFLLFLVGLSPYIYIVIVSYFNSSPINWMGSLSLTNFFNLVTRARYGTFQSGGYTAHDPLLRMLNVWAFFDFVFKDFRMPGIILAFLGFYRLVKQQKTIFLTILIGILSYLFFLFLASFPLVDNFMVATFERFILTLYILLIPILAFGLIQLENITSNYLILITKRKKQQLFNFLILLILFIYPLGLLFLNYGKINILKNDFSAEYLGHDILTSLPQSSVLLLTTDTPLFDTQYVYYVQKLRPDVKLIHLTSLFNPDDLIRLGKLYPDLQFPNIKTDPGMILKEFLVKNYPQFPIYSKLTMGTNEGTWIPYGLVFRYIANDNKKPTDESILMENEKLWSNYHIPTSGSLAKYHNLMLSDILPIYATAHQEIGFWAAKNKYSKLAEKHLLSAQSLYPKDLDSYIILAQVYMVDKRCQDAQNQIDEVAKRNKDDARIYFLQAINYAVCFQEKEKALYYQKLYEEKKSEKDTNLKIL